MNADALSKDLPDAVRRLIGVPMYEERSEFDIELGYVFNTCAAVQNANPLYWQRDVADAITAGPITPPTMLSVWFRPHHWTPGASGERKAMQLHFDLKEQLGLPEAVVVTHESVFGEPVRPGDVLSTCQILQSIGEPKQTRVGRGRFWTIDVRATNQRGDWVGTESYSFLGYARPQP